MEETASEAFAGVAPKSAVITALMSRAAFHARMPTFTGASEKRHKGGTVTPSFVHGSPG